MQLDTRLNQIQLGSSAETVYCSKLSMPTNYILTYSSISSTIDVSTANIQKKIMDEKLILENIL